MQVPNPRTQEEFDSTGHQTDQRVQSAQSIQQSVPLQRVSSWRASLAFPSTQRTARNFETPSVGPIRASSQGSCGTVVPDTPVTSQDIDMGAEMGEMDRLSQVLGRVELSGNADLQHHMSEILRMLRKNC